MTINIFVSRPNTIDNNQNETIKKLAKLLEDRGMCARTIGTTDFPNVSPMRAVEQLMIQCSGAVILGFPQLEISKAISKPNTNQQKTLKNILLPTPWNHIESSMAYMLQLPMLIIRHEGIEGGIFDIGTTGHFIHTFNLSDSNCIKENNFTQPFNSWYGEVLTSNKNQSHSI